MTIKLLNNITHIGIFLQAGEILDGIEDAICKTIVERGLAEETTEAATKTFTPTGVTPSDPINPADAHTGPRDQSSTQAVAGLPVVPAAGVAPTDVAVDAVPEATTVAAPQPLTVQPTAEQIAAEVSGIK
jgi:type V secretory pathway adhesin AidA